IAPRSHAPYPSLGDKQHWFDPCLRLVTCPGSLITDYLSIMPSHTWGDCVLLVAGASKGQDVDNLWPDLNCCKQASWVKVEV
ncbi:mCG64442, isoform CRA_a, partial [Mus musculus]